MPDVYNISKPIQWAIEPDHLKLVVVMCESVRNIFLQYHPCKQLDAGSMIFNKRHMYSHSEMSESTGIETKH